MKKKVIIGAIAVFVALFAVSFIAVREVLDLTSKDDFYTWSRVHLSSLILNTSAHNKRLVAASPSGQDVYAVEYYGGYTHRSTDSGKSWVALDSTPDADFFTAIIVDHNNHVFFGTSSGLYRSTDKGATWTKCTKGMWSSIIDAFALDSKGRIYASGDKNAVYRSDDGGNSWKKIGIGQNTIYDYHIDLLCITPEGHIFASNEYSIFSSDDGNNWKKLKLKAGHTYPAKDDFCIDAISAGSKRGFYICNWSSLCKVTAQGNWNPISIGSDAFGEEISCHTVIASPNGHVVVGTSDGAYVSINDGKSWKKLSTTICGFYRPNIDCISVDSKGKIFASAGDSIFIGTPRK